MNSIFKKLSIPEVILIEPKIFSDNRGFFFENFKEDYINGQSKIKISDNDIAKLILAIYKVDENSLI